MEKELQKLMKMYQQAECDHDLNMGETLTEHLMKRIEKSTKGYKNREHVIEDYKICCDAYLQARFIEFNMSVVAVIISLLAVFISIVDLQEKSQIQDMALTLGFAAVLIIFLVIVVSIIAIKLKQKETKVRKIMFVVQKIEEELKEKK